MAFGMLYLTGEALTFWMPSAVMGQALPHGFLEGLEIKTLDESVENFDPIGVQDHVTGRKAEGKRSLQTPIAQAP